MNIIAIKIPIGPAALPFLSHAQLIQLFAVATGQGLPTIILSHQCLGYLQTSKELCISSFKPCDRGGRGYKHSSHTLVTQTVWITQSKQTKLHMHSPCMGDITYYYLLVVVLLVLCRIQMCLLCIFCQ